MDTQKAQQRAIVSDASADPLIGTTIGERFRLISKVGSGGLSDVYKACEIATVRTVAIKIIRISKDSGKSGFELFTSNARPSVQHPNLVSMLACGLTEEGEPWLALEWLEGRTLAELLSQEGTLPMGTILPVFQQISDALAYAHNKGEVHINLKPSNILIVQRDGAPFVKICDFGFAKLLIERELEMADEKAPARGSALYMSPEQFKGTRIDSKSDIYSFGCMLYECLVGRPPHEGNDLLDTMDRHMHVDVSFPSEPEVLPQMQAVLSKMLAKDSARRHRTLSDAMADILGAMNGEFPKEEQLPRSNVDAGAVDFITAKRGAARKKGHEPWMLLMGCVTVLLFVLIFQQCMNMVRDMRHGSAPSGQKIMKHRYVPGANER
jgi:serine/threonine-protein kinase